MSFGSMVRVAFKKTHPNAQLPKQGKLGDAGFDLACVEDFTLAPGVTRAISTGLVLAQMDPQDDTHGTAVFLHVVGRSGLALKGIFPIGGIIDATYRGEIKVILHNGSGETQNFKSGFRVAQLLVQKVVTNDGVNGVVFEETTDVTETVRGANGFGSTNNVTVADTSRSNS
jgi:dUTP pyrophosphatase